MRIRLVDPERLADLQRSLQAADCTATPLEDGTLVVLHQRAVDAAEEAVELSFFLKAWEARQPGRVVELA
jgi:hypothetical protein